MLDDLNLSFQKFMFRMNGQGRKRLWRKLSTLLSNGVPILDALRTMHTRRVQSGMGRDATAVALKSWMDEIRNGSRLSQAVKDWVQQDEQMLISAGEFSGTLDKTLNASAEVMDAKKKISDAVIGGIAYPVVLVAIAFAALIMFSFKIIPVFSNIVKDDQWTGMARTIVDVANFSRDYIFVIIAVLLIIIVAFIMSLPRWSEGFRIKLDRYPPYNLYRVVVGSVWMISLATLVGAGMRVETALERLSQNASPWLRRRIYACLKGMRSGMNAGDALAQSGYEFPDREIIDDLGVYAHLSGFENALNIIGREWINTSVEKVQGIMNIIFGVCVMLVGLLIAFMVSGLIAMELQMTTIMQTRNM
jgi:type II secretory pathway component PulF